MQLYENTDYAEIFVQLLARIVCCKGHLMDMGPNEKYFKHVNEANKRRKGEENQTQCGREKEEGDDKEMVIPQCKYPL